MNAHGQDATLGRARYEATHQRVRPRIQMPVLDDIDREAERVGRAMQRSLNTTSSGVHVRSLRGKR